MTPTHQRALREAIAGAIAQIVPRPWNRPEEVWHRTRSINDVEAASPRTFFVRLRPSERAEGGISGDGYEVEADLEIWTSYVGIEDDEDGPMIDDDQRQLWTALVDLADPATSGLAPLYESGWTYEDESPGSVRGFHRFKIRYLVSDSTNF